VRNLIFKTIHALSNVSGAVTFKPHNSKSVL